MTIMPAGSEMLGVPLPNLPHAISVSLPRWDDNVRWAARDERIIDVMNTGYPRFFIHRDIQALTEISEKEFGQPGERCFLFPAAYIANAFRQFMTNHSPDPASPIPVRVVQYVIRLERGSPTEALDEFNTDCVELHGVLFQEDVLLLGKQFWQHTGLGISSRLASTALGILAQNGEHAAPAVPPLVPRSHGLQYYKHSSPTTLFNQSLLPSTHHLRPAVAVNANYNHVAYYGQHLQDHAGLAKSILRRRIVGALANDSLSAVLSDNMPGAGAVERGEDVTQDDVFLFSSGMAAIWTSYQLIMSVRPGHKSVCFGFSYSDTLKILQKWGPGFHFFARGEHDDINELSSILQTESISALYTEFPSNPLLRSANLPRLRELADKYGFPIVVDDTIGSFVNVDVLPYVDIIVTSLSKTFSGTGNALGGSLVLNPKGKHYQRLKSQLECIYEDTYWGEDAIVLERNSRDFISRVHTMNQNAEVLCDFLHSRSLSAPSPAPGTVIKEVYYPKWETRANYDICRRPSSGFGGLFTITFTTMDASRAFFDSLDCAKGANLGTNFTLVCPYAILAHYAELDWAKAYGIDLGLVRVSVGLEERDELLGRFMVALEKAEATAH